MSVPLHLNHEAAAREVARQGRTITEVAEAIGMARPNLSNCLAGRRPFPPEKIAPLAAYLAVPPFMLLGPEDPKAALIELAQIHGLTLVEAVSA